MLAAHPDPYAMHRMRQSMSFILVLKAREYKEAYTGHVYVVAF